ncbi:hypothetical protein ACFC0M_06145 [Streptomyces sp. NPDC056149]|uniref:hypothetical protein n=1 Tax=Streptomyces sp. NPDC056149 TaxID=3345728 RepID=UPI0035E0B49B
MHDHEESERLASYADVLAGELPGTWTSTYHPPGHTDDLHELTDRAWDMDLVAESLAQHPLQHAAVLTRQDGAQLLVAERHDGRDSLLAAALAPRSLPDEAYQGVGEPNGIALGDDPFLSAQQITRDLLPRYDAALAQVRHHAAGVRPSQPDRVVLTWQPDGSLAASPVGKVAAAVLAANGFVEDQHSGIHRLSGEDTFAQARAVRETGQALKAQGIDTALQHPSGRIATTSTRPAAPSATPVPAAPTASARRSP